MKKKRVIILLLILISLSVAGYFSIKPAFSYLSGYLSKSEEVQADVLIVEGWLPDKALEMAYKEYLVKGYRRIITTGMKSMNTYFNIYSNGYLIFYTGSFLSGINDSGRHVIGVKAYSQMEGENMARFNLYINDSLLSGFSADTKKRNYNVSWEGSLKNIDSVMVEFVNDTVGDFGDRNLFVSEVDFNGSISIPYLNNSAYDIAALDNKYRSMNGIVSNAELAREKLISFGIDSARIKAVSAERVKINRTLTSAIAFRDWLRSSGEEVNGINIISQGSHARRTWLTYNKILDEKFKIGIISLPQNNTLLTGRKEYLKTAREMLGIIYYWFILIPY